MRRPGSDALSQETAFAGLPKIIRIHASIAQGPLGVNVWTNISLDTVDYNYGGFAFRPASPGSEIVVPEPGIYVCTLNTRLNGVAANGEITLCSNVNGTGPTQLGLVTGDGANYNVSGGAQGSGPLFMNAGDTIGMQAFNNVASSVAAGWTHLTLMKMGGVY